jgi:predicted ester cyclase
MPTRTSFDATSKRSGINGRWLRATSSWLTTFSEHAAAPFAATAPGKVHGPTAMRGTAEWLLGQFPDLSIRIESIVADEDMVAVRVRLTGTNSGSITRRSRLQASSTRTRISTDYVYKLRAKIRKRER